MFSSHTTVLVPSEKMDKRVPYLSIKGLTKIYNEHPVLNGLDLSLFKHEKLGVIGLSGSGKSTLLRLIFGLLDKDGGEIRLEDERVKDRSEVLVPGDDRVKYVRQNYELFPDHTVFENIEHQIRYKPKDVIEKRVKKLLKAFDIENIRDKKTKLASGGEQQRVAICCALAESPELLLLDEPMAHLDPINARQIKSFLWRFIDKEKITTIFVTHSSEEALAYASRVAVIHNGKILESASPTDLYFQPKKKVSAQLIGEISKIPKEFLPEEIIAKSSKQLYLRPENIAFSANGVLAVVEHCMFLGNQYLIGAKLGRESVYFYCTEKIEEQKEISLSMDFEKAIWL